jgi:hypothetical protein
MYEQKEKNMSLFVFSLIVSLHMNTGLPMDHQRHPLKNGSTINRAVRMIVQASENTVDLEQPPKASKTPQTTSSGNGKSPPQTESNSQPRQKKRPPFKEFMPSEEIEVDHAVDFPVDI